ncbi:probable serine/threonine-protein kinase DDB_G0282963 [Contarinia nasturtii]|uniref:probable serine/threonine-protein kinase DDB_G0282963 n=1 Tax=Contarinia nasturtii TaxID=265458 RepID=UPI0012D4A93E|nr:probable serine/threonine-protein kinase DDB_G0282963 [Contarinia nasturtii]XP_031616933.1 probable serine/threonine-protein kinase DDB_G0282963 [Contarinia nasturtii]
MSADIGVPWRSSAVCSGESRSPSLSSLPPLPDLIPIRKSNNNTLIKANLKHANPTNNGSACTNATNNIETMNSHPNSDQNGNIANDDSQFEEQLTDIKPNATELSLYKTYDGNRNGTEREDDEEYNDDDNDNDDDDEEEEENDQHIEGKAAAKLSMSIKQEHHRRCSNDDDGDAFRKCANAYSADAMATVCVSIGGSYFTNANGNTVQCDRNVDGGQLKHINNTSLIKNEKCQNSGDLMNSTNSQCNNTDFGSFDDQNVEQKSADSRNDSQKSTNNVGQRPQNGKAGNKKSQNNYISDMPKRTTRSALDTYECKARLYTPLPAHYYSVQYARAARKPKRKVLKGKGRGGVTKVGRKPKTKSNTTKNASLALESVTEKTTTSSTTATPQMPSRINPIFLFVKRDNTRIVEVRCEDYDKRNRIRLTKTASGWRATPRTDVSNENATNVSATMLPKVMVKRLEDSDTKILNQNANNIENDSDKNSTWRVNPFSQNRIFIKKDVCTALNNNDCKFNSMYENRQSHDGNNSSNAEHSSGMDTSASDKVHLLNESSSSLATRKKHKKKKKKKKEKHKSKLDKMLLTTTEQFGSHSDVSSKQTTQNDAISEDGQRAHVTLIPKSMVVASKRNASGNANANECKFTIRLSKNGESSFVATKKFSTISSIPSSSLSSSSRSPKPEFNTSNEKSNGLRLKIVAEQRQQFLTERDHFSDEQESNSVAEMHSVAVEQQQQQATEVDCDSGEMYDGIDAETKMNLDALSASVSNVELAATIDCEKIDTKKEIVTPAESPYSQVEYPSLSPSSLQPHHHHHRHRPIQMQSNDAVELSNTFIKSTRGTQQQQQQPSTTSETISSCRNNDIETFASPDSAPVETFDSKLSVKQCVASRNSANAASTAPTAAPTQFQCSDNNNSIDENLSIEKHLEDCVDLLDESSYDIENIQVSEPHEIGVDNESHSNQLHHDLGEYHELIARIQSGDDDLLNGDNTMSGTELIDSLVERGCKDNNISGEDEENQHNDLKNSICLSDDYNDVDTNLLLSSQPVVDILTRLNNETMASSSSSSTKCLSFNEAGEIEGLSDALFSNAKGDSLVPFNQSAFEELSMTLKGLEKQSNQNTNGKDVVCTVVSPDSCEDELPKDLSFKKTKEISAGLRIASPRTISRGSDAIQSPQPSGLPAVPPSPDIIMALHQHRKQNSLFLDISSPSPKPSEANVLHSKSDFFDLSSPIPKDDNDNNSSSNTNITSNSNTNINNNNNNNSRSILKRTLQREPLDLGHKHRKSASPTISCSEEVQRLSAMANGEPLARRIKTEHRTDNNSLLAAAAATATSKDTSQSSASAKDPDPLTQLRLLINNPEWKLPDPILVPKNRLNAVLASPAREIPLLLTTRPELRLPEAFAYPSILQDPDILVISFAQLETIIRKQSEFMKDADPNRNLTSNNNKHSTAATSSSQQTKSTSNQRDHQHSNQHHKDRKHTEKLPETIQSSHDKNTMKATSARTETTAVSPAGNPTTLANDINSATLEALNQMIWLPYLSQLSQMGQITPELLKAMSMSNLPMQPNAFAAAGAAAATQFGLSNALPNLNNPLELAMWQEATANKVAFQRLMEMNAQNIREVQRKAINDAKMQQRSQDNIAAALRQQQTLLQQAQMQKSASAFFQNFQNRTQQTQQKSPAQPFLSSAFGKDSQNEASQQQQRTACNLPSPTLPKRLANAMNQSPFFPSTNNFSNMANLHHKFGMGGSGGGAGSSGGNTSDNANNTATSQNALRKARKEQLLQQQQLQTLLLQNAAQHSQLNLPVHHHHQSNESSNKSLMNLLQQSNLEQMRSQRNETMANSNKMLSTIPSFDLTSPNSQQQTSNSNTNRPKLRVKNGLHLLDPLAAQRRFLSGNAARCNDSPEIGSTTNGIDEMMMNSGVLNSQSSYTSPWHWTKVTATGE